jgi:hypothetical protein
VFLLCSVLSDNIQSQFHGTLSRCCAAQLSKRFGFDEASREAAAKQPKLDADALFWKSKAMLDHLGLVKYHRNIKNGLMTDSTIMLWNDSSLQECRIPPGPRYDCSLLLQVCTKDSNPLRTAGSDIVPLII